MGRRENLYIRVFESMKKQNPRRYQVAGLGNWGVVDGLVYENWEEKAFDIEEIREIKWVQTAFGLDFGYTNDPSTLFCGFIDTNAKTIWVFDEMYGYGMSNEKIAQSIIKMGYMKEKIRADCAEPKSIDRLKALGISRTTKARKGKDSVSNGIDFIQDYHIIIHPRCVNFITEIGNYTWVKDKNGKMKNEPIDDFNHLMDAMRYALEEYSEILNIMTIKGKHSKQLKMKYRNLITKRLLFSTKTGKQFRRKLEMQIV